MKKTNEKIYLERLKSQMAFLKFILGITTAILGSGIAQIQLIDYGFWPQFIGGFVGGFVLWNMVDNTLDMITNRALSKWAGAKIDGKVRRSAMQLTGIGIVILIFSGTLTLMSNTLITKGIAGSAPVAMKDNQAEKDKAFKQKQKEVSSSYKDYNNKKDEIKNFEASRNELLRALVSNQGSDFANGYNKKQSYVISSNRVPRYVKSMKTVNKFIAETSKLKAVKDKELLSIEKRGQSKRDKIENRVDVRLSTIDKMTDNENDAHASFVSVIKYALVFAESLTALLFGILFWMTVVHLQEHDDLEYGEEPIGLSSLIALLANRVSTMTNVVISGLIGSIFDNTIYKLVKWLNFASTVQNPNLNAFVTANALNQRSVFNETNKRPTNQQKIKESGVVSDTPTPTDQNSRKMDDNRQNQRETNRPTTDQQKPTQTETRPTSEDIKPILLNQPVSFTYKGRKDGSEVIEDYSFTISFYEINGIVHAKNISGGAKQYISKKEINNAFSTYKGRIFKAGKDTNANVEKYCFLTCLRGVIDKQGF